MLNLLGTIRRLRTAIENPLDNGNGLVTIPLNESEIEQINAVFDNALLDPEILPANLEEKLHSLLPIWKLVNIPKTIDKSNYRSRKNLEIVREIEFILLKDCESKKETFQFCRNGKSGKNQKIDSLFSAG